MLYVCYIIVLKQKIWSPRQVLCFVLGDRIKESGWNLLIDFKE